MGRSEVSTSGVWVLGTGWLSMSEDI